MLNLMFNHYKYINRIMNSKSRAEIIICIILFTLPSVFYSCGASSTVRYERNKKEENKKTETESVENSYDEDFNVLPYRTDVDIKEKSAEDINTPDLNPWYGYEDKDTSAVEEKEIVGTTNGFRVQVFASDNLQDADSLKSELLLKVSQKNIYVIFDPPFYKVVVGDFTSMSDAKDLNFKLTQMGYTESRVISSTVNIFE